MLQIKFLKNQKAHFVINEFFSENLAVCEIMWKNILEPGRPQMTVWCMRVI